MGVCAGIALVLAIVIAISYPRSTRPVLFRSEAEAFPKLTAWRRAYDQVRFFLFKPATAFIKAEIASTERVPSLKTAEQILGEPALAESNRTMVWILNKADHSRVLAAIAPGRDEVISRPNVQIGDSLEGSLYAGSSVPIGATNVDVGTSLRVRPNVRKDGIAVTLGVSATAVATNSSSNIGATVETNAAFALKALIPRDHLLLVISQPHTNRQPVLVLVHAETVQ